MSPPTPTSIMLVNGRYFDYLAPDPAVIDLDVLEHGLDVPRYNNQTIRPITVLEHSLRVWRIVRELGGDDAAQLWAVNHDDHEALVPWGDCLGPGKTPEMKAIEADVDVAIREALGITLPSSEAFELVKTADAIALYFEALTWQPGAIGWATNLVDWRLLAGDDAQIEFERFMPLIAPRPGECWRTEVEALLDAASPPRRPAPDPRPG